MKQIGTDKAEGQALKDIQERGGTWYAYQNVELGHCNLGHLKFLRCGVGCTYTEPPKRLPDMPDAINWRYWLVGIVDPATGEIHEIKELIK